MNPPTEKDRRLPLISLFLWMGLLFGPVLSSAAGAIWNDDFANAGLLSGGSGMANGTNATATIERGEPLHAGLQTDASVWWRWTAPTTGWVTFDTFGSDFDTVLAVYTGKWESLVEIASNDDAAGTTQSAVAFPATGGTTYSIAVAGYNLFEIGNIVLNWTTTGGVPANDNFADARIIRDADGSVTGTNLRATLESGEPLHTGQPGAASVWWRWTAPETGWVTFDTFGSDFDTVLAVYTGEWGDLRRIAQNDDAPGTVLSSVTFAARSGTTFSIVVAGYDEWETGSILLNWTTDTSVPENDLFADAVVIDGPSGSATGHNVNATAEPGEPNHANAPRLSSVWWQWTAPASGWATFDTFGSDFDTVLAAYSGSWENLTERAANDDAPGGAMLQSEVSFVAVAGTTYSIAVAGYNDRIGGIVLNWDLDSTPPANDNFAEATLLSGDNGTAMGTNVSATSEPGESEHAGEPRAASVWWRWTATVTGVATIDTFGSDFDTVLAVYEGEWGSLTELASDDDSGAGLQSRVSLEVTLGGVYHIAVAGYGADDMGTIVLKWTAETTVAPANDFFADAIVLSGSGGSVTGSNFGATLEAGEPEHAGDSTGVSVWWRWTAPVTGVATIDTFGSDFDTVLAVYAGAWGSLTEIASNDDADGWLMYQSEVVFSAAGGTEYFIAVAGYDTLAKGNIVLNWNLEEGAVPSGRYADWSAAIADPSLRLPGMSARGDGIANLLRYALGAGPYEDVAGRMPAITIDSQGRPVIELVCSAAVADLRLDLQLSADLGVWMTVASSIGGLPFANLHPDVLDVEEFAVEGDLRGVRIVENSTGVQARFARLRMTLLEE